MRMRQGWIALAVVLLAAMGACTKPDGEGVASAGGQTGQNQADPSAPSDNPDERGRQFVQCMRDQGIDVPDPEPGDRTGKTALRFESGNVDKAKLGPAMEVCGNYMPGGGEPVKFTPEQIEEQRQFAQCMRDNGVPQWPDPDPENGGFKGSGNAEQLSKDDPAIRAALEKCRSHITPPSRGPGQG